MTFDELILRTGAYACLECGVCTGSCPVARIDGSFSPRLTVERALLEAQERSIEATDAWTCLTCHSCGSRCPAEVDYDAFVRGMRSLAVARGLGGVCTHAGTVRAFQELQLSHDFRRDTSAIEKEVQTAEEGAWLYFTGCLAYFGVVFGDLGIDGTGMAQAALRLLNAVGIVPVVSPHERCCGHDLYWSGEEAGFERLARRNLEMIKGSGAEHVVFSCPEGYYMFKTAYPALFGMLPFEVLHLTEVLVEAARAGRAPQFARPEALAVSYQDPCRLGRYGGIYDEPRELIRAVEGAQLAEMGRVRHDAVCCGSSSWVNCSRANKRIQVERLREAAATGAGRLLTACPKCLIHLRCALHDGGGLAGEIGMEVSDLFVFLAESLVDGTGAPARPRKRGTAAQRRRRGEGKEARERKGRKEKGQMVGRLKKQGRAKKQGGEKKRGEKKKRGKERKQERRRNRK